MCTQSDGYGQLFFMTFVNWDLVYTWKVFLCHLQRSCSASAGSYQSKKQQKEMQQWVSKFIFEPKSSQGT